MEQQQAPQLSYQDMAAVLQFIDMATTRGAVRGSEMLTVGLLRDKIERFLNSPAPTQPSADEKEDE